MADVSTDLLEMALREIAATGGQPWYPSVYSQATGVPRDALDRVLDQLRLAGLVRLTDWEQGRGQGYTLTPEGQLVLDNPRLLARLREGREVPRPRLRNAPVEDLSLRGTGTYFDRAEAIRSALLSQARPVVTYVLLWLNILVFGIGLVMAMNRQVTDAYLGSMAGRDGVNVIRHEIGGLQGGDITARGEWWRLLSYCFVHGGAIHLLMNMFVLYMFGSLVEKMWGRGRFLIVYLVSGLGGSVLQLLVDPRFVTNPNFSMVGASGCLCGLLGSMAVWVVMNRPYLPAKLASSWMNNVIMNVMLIAFISMVPGVSWAGHLGGGMAGAVVSAPLVWTLYGAGRKCWLGWVGTAAVPLASLLILNGAIAPALEIDDADPELKKAQAEYRPIVARVGSLGEVALRKPLAEFRDEGAAAKAGPEAVKQAQAVAQLALGRLKEARDALDKVGPYRSPALRHHIELTRESATKFANFYQAFLDKLAPEQGPAERREAVNTLRKRWEDAARFWDDEVRGPAVYRQLFLQ